jgi:hypothetical protein
MGTCTKYDTAHVAVLLRAEGGVGLPTPSSSSSRAPASSDSSSDSDSFDQSAAADAHLVQTAAAFGNLLSSVSAAPRQRYSLAGLGFGLPMSRLYARYFGEGPGCCMGQRMLTGTFVGCAELWG